jgi:L-methionine (R)-S-oxide reductase
MSETITISTTASKSDKYISLLPQIKALTETETDLTATLANVVAALKYGLDFFWVGFYVVKGQELVLAPFQGTVACTRIAFGKGVCGAAYREGKTQLVPDVENFVGHIACSSASRSEIVVPIFKNNQVVAVLDVDSTELNDFDEIDQLHLEALASYLSAWF